MPIAQRPPAEEYLAARLVRLRAAMAAEKAPALLVTSFKDVSYLTGFEGDDSFLIVTPERVVLLSDARYAEQIAREAPFVEPVIRTRGIFVELGRVLKKLKIKKLGVQAESLTLKQRDQLLEEFTGKDKPRLAPVDEIVIALRHIKDAREIAIIEQAVAIAEHGFEAMRAALRPGMTENEIASLLTHEMRKRGADDASFDTIIAAGANASLPHYRPRDVKLQVNSFLLVDWGARVHGYVSDLTRMIFVGSIPPAIAAIYDVVLEAQQAAIAAIKPGKTGKQIDKIARDIITKAGYGEQFGHGLGHGIGRDIHEAIALSRLSTTRLEPGMVITAEPGIYLPGVGGVRIEDDVLVTATGCRVLSHLPKSRESAQRS